MSFPLARVPAAPRCGHRWSPMISRSPTAWSGAMRCSYCALHGQLNCLECSTALRESDCGRCLGRGHNSNLYLGCWCRENSVRGRRQSDWVLTADPQQKLFASFLNSEHPACTIAIGTVESVKTRCGWGVAHSLRRRRPAIFSLDRVKQLFEEGPPLIRIDHDRGALARVRIGTRHLLLYKTSLVRQIRRLSFRRVAAGAT